MKKDSRCLYVILSILAAFFGSLAMGRASPFGHEVSKSETVRYNNALPVTAENPSYRSIRRMTSTLYDRSNGLLTNEANTVVQTDDGFIWVGSFSGLMRFDGRTFRNFSRETGIPALSSVVTLFESSDSRLYIGTNTDGVYRYDGASFVKIGTIKTSVREFIERDGTIYAATSLGVARVTEDDCEILEYFSGKSYTNIALDAAGRMWARQDNGTILYLENGRVHVHSEVSTPHRIVAIGENVLICDASGNIHILDVTDLTLQKVIKTGELTTINRVYIENETSLWLCANEGIGFIDIPSWTYLPCSQYLTQEKVSDICRDYEGSLWMASADKGLYKAVPGVFTDLSAITNLSGSSVNATLVYGEGLYIAGNGFNNEKGLTILRSDETLVTNELTQLLENERVRCLMTDSLGNLWLSTFNNYGLIRYNVADGGLRFFTDEAGRAHLEDTKYKDDVVVNKDFHYIRNTLELQNGSILVATSGRGAFVVSGDKDTYTLTELTEVSDNSSNSTILSLAQDPFGNIYVGTDGGGVLVLDEDYRYLFTLDTDVGLTANIIMRMLVDTTNEGIWLTCGTNLCFYSYVDSETRSPGQIKVIDKLASFGSGSVLDVKFRREGLLWVFKSTCIVEIESARLLSDRPLTAEDYIAVDDVGSGLTFNISANSYSYFDEDGNCFICTNNGVYYISNGLRPFSDLPEIKLVITSIAADNGTIPDHTEIGLSHQNKRIVVQFSAPSFVNKNFRVGYILEGFDEEVMYMGGSDLQDISYTNLPTGNYTLRIWTENSAGVVGQVAEIHIVKQPSFLENPLALAGFSILALATVIGLAALFVYLKLRTVRRRQEEYRLITNQSLKMLANTIDAKDPYTRGHSDRVAHVAAKLARRIGLSEDEIEQIHFVGLLHDIGKIGIPDEILNKNGKLTEEEYSVIKKHVNIGGDILKDVSSIKEVSEGARHHHERFDGYGYPDGLKGEDISLTARIICVADSYDAMSHTRVYRAKLSEDMIISELEKGKGTQFDPNIAQAMIDLIKEGDVFDSAAKDNNYFSSHRPSKRKRHSLRR